MYSQHICQSSSRDALKHRWFVTACAVVRRNITHHILLKRSCPLLLFRCSGCSGCGDFITALQLVNHKWGGEVGGCHIYTTDTIVFYAALGRMNRPISTCTSLEEFDLVHLVVRGKLKYQLTNTKQNNEANKSMLWFLLAIDANHDVTIQWQLITRLG